MFQAFLTALNSTTGIVFPVKMQRERFTAEWRLMKPAEVDETRWKGFIPELLTSGILTADKKKDL